jgi:hypothetical protein
VGTANVVIVIGADLASLTPTTVTTVAGAGAGATTTTTV